MSTEIGDLLSELEGHPRSRGPRRRPPAAGPGRGAGRAVADRPARERRVAGAILAGLAWIPLLTLVGGLPRRPRISRVALPARPLGGALRCRPAARAFAARPGPAGRRAGAPGARRHGAGRVPGRGRRHVAHGRSRRCPWRAPPSASPARSARRSCRSRWRRSCCAARSCRRRRGGAPRCGAPCGLGVVIGIHAHCSTSTSSSTSPFAHGVPIAAGALLGAAAGRCAGAPEASRGVAHPPRPSPRGGATAADLPPRAARRIAPWRLRRGAGQV